MRIRVIPTAARLLAVPAALLLVTAPAGASAHAHTRSHSHAQSNPNWFLGKGRSVNWAGYVSQGGPFNSVAASWTVPAARCDVTPNAASAAWVGLDGSGSRTVEQTGTLSSCSGGAPAYAAWFELFPKPLSIISQPVGPGDSMSASVVAQGKSSFVLSITDNSRGWTANLPAQRRARRASAEVVAEAPSGFGGVLPLADFGSVGFSGATVNGAPLANSGPIAVNMVSRSGVLKAATGPLSGGSFSVTWRSP
jgi:hypothetical protein